jgi:AraC-like DNA-binding protein
MEGYYFISEDTNSNIIRYKTFPNNYSILSVAQFADVLFEEGRITVVPSATKEISTDIVLRYTNPIEVVYSKAVNEVTFYFKPLGLNQFIPDSDFFSKHKSLMDYIVSADFNEKMYEIFGIESREKQIEELESYWLSKLQVKDFSLMEKLLTDIETSDLKIDEIAKKFNFSRQYINKLFLKYIGKSPAEYRKIHRFRSAIKKRNEIKNLTELSHENLFYDQSHFNKDFKELTSVNPSSFFKNVDTERENIWLFV